MILTTCKEEVEIQRVRVAGARGYLLKSLSPKILVLAIRQVHAGSDWETGLTADF